MKKIITIILLFSLISTIFNSCVLLGKALPLEKFYYPFFGNGYEKEMLVIIKYTNGYISTGRMEKSVTSVVRQKGLIIEAIQICDTDNNLIAEYDKEYLDNEREKVKNPANEFWAAYENGLVLIPEEYFQEKDWLKYIKSLKEGQ